MYPETEVLFSTRKRRAAMDQAVILSAARIPFRMLRVGPVWTIEVDAIDAERARNEVAAVQRINRNWPPPDPSLAAPTFTSYAPFGVVAMLLVFALWLGLWQETPIQQAAASNAEAIRAGEWWRCFTALGLHGDLQHLVGNCFFLAVFAWAWCSRVGDGLGCWLILLSGAGGNALVALIDPQHVSIGASTACFSALGLLTGMRAVELIRLGSWNSMAKQALLPIGAGLAMLALTGAGDGSPEVDLAAHLFGLLTGIACGAPLGLPRLRLRTEWIQRCLELSCLLFYLLTWRLAFLHAAP